MFHVTRTFFNPLILRASLAHRIGAGKTQDGGNRRLEKRLVPLVSMSSNQIFRFLLLSLRANPFLHRFLRRSSGNFPMNQRADDVSHS